MYAIKCTVCHRRDEASVPDDPRLELLCEDLADKFFCRGWVGVFVLTQPIISCVGKCPECVEKHNDSENNHANMLRMRDFM